MLMLIMIVFYIGLIITTFICLLRLGRFKKGLNHKQADYRRKINQWKK